MSECYFTVERANKLLAYMEGKLPDEIWFEAMQNACREIIRLNEVIEGMRRENIIQRATIDIYELRHADNVQDAPDAP